jgi:serine/threonine-protein kinase
VHACLDDAEASPLGEILVEQGALKPENHALLEPLVHQHLREHDNDAQKSLGALRSVSSVRCDLEQIADAEVQASLGHIGADSLGGTIDHVPALPATVIRYTRLRPHRRGGLCEVFVALDEELNREVALKEIQNEHADRNDSRTGFLLEAEVTGQQEHPGVVPVYGLGRYEDGRPFYAMRFIRGDSLKEAIERFHRDEASMSPGQRVVEQRGLLGRFLDVCDAVAYAHSRGVLHRDLKPGNVMLGRYGETLVVDWGLAKLVGSNEEPAGEDIPLKTTLSGDVTPTEAGKAVGTPARASSSHLPPLTPQRPLESRLDPQPTRPPATGRRRLGERSTTHPCSWANRPAEISSR